MGNYFAVAPIATTVLKDVVPKHRLPDTEDMSTTSDFGTFGRYGELPLDSMTADQKRAYEFTVKERGQVPGPYKIWLQNPKLMEVMVPLGV